MAVDIVIQETIDLVDITVTPNIIEVNVTRTSGGGGGGSQTLAQTLDLGNSTGGENIFINTADAIELQNTSLLKKGTYNFGGDGGISRICSNNYEDMWQNGFRHVFDQSGFIRTSSNGFDAIPDSSFDVTLRFKVGSFWSLDDGTTYVCIDNTEGAAVWELYVTNIPTLQQVLDNDNNLVDGNFIAGDAAGDGNIGVSVNAFGNLAALNNEGSNINALGDNSANGNLANNVNAFGSGTALDNTFTHINLFGENATADENGQTVLSKDGSIMARISTTELTESRKYTLQDADGTIAFLSDITGATPTLQEVTDAGATTTNPIIIDGTDTYSVIDTATVGTQDKNTDTYAYLGSTGELGLKNLDGILSNLRTTNTTEPIVLEFPDKVTGNYTLATVDDIPTLTSQLTNDGADGVNPFITALDIPVAGEASTLVREVKNMTGATLTKGTVVFISGANGNKALVSKAIATTDALSARTFGLLQSNILNNGLGNCVIIGDLSGINTSAFAEGAQLYLSGTVAGAFTDVRTLAPTHLVYIGKVTRVHPTQGQIEVQIQNGYELEEIHDVQIITPLNNQTILYETSSQLWKNKTIIEDSITNGVTDIAPSQNAVFDALDLTRRLITNGTGSVTGTTAETILTSLTIPANTLDSKCFIWTTMDYFKSSPNACTLRLYINTTNSVSGATLIGFASVGSARNVSFNRKLYLNATTLDFLSSNTGATQISNEFIEAIFGASTTLTVNPAANIFLIYTTQNDAVGTTATSKQATVQKLKLN